MAMSLHAWHQGARKKLFGVDPVSVDPGLARLLCHDVCTTTTTTTRNGIDDDDDDTDNFLKWRISVVGRYEAYIELTGLEKARLVEESLVDRLFSFSNTIRALESETTQEENEYLHRLKKQASDLTATLSEFLPSSSEMEKKTGHDRYQVGAVMVRNNFRVFELLTTTRDRLNTIRRRHMQGSVGSKSSSDESIRMAFRAYTFQVATMEKTLSSMSLYDAMVRVRTFVRRQRDPSTKRTNKPASFSTVDWDEGETFDSPPDEWSETKTDFACGTDSIHRVAETSGSTHRGKTTAVMSVNVDGNDTRVMEPFTPPRKTNPGNRKVLRPLSNTVHEVPGRVDRAETFHSSNKSVTNRKPVKSTQTSRPPRPPTVGMATNVEEDNNNRRISLPNTPNRRTTTSSFLSRSCHGEYKSIEDSVKSYEALTSTSDNIFVPRPPRRNYSNGCLGDSSSGQGTGFASKYEHAALRSFPHTPERVRKSSYVQKPIRRLPQRLDPETISKFENKGSRSLPNTPDRKKNQAFPSIRMVGNNLRNFNGSISSTRSLPSTPTREKIYSPFHATDKPRPSSPEAFDSSFIRNNSTRSLPGTPTRKKTYATISPKGPSRYQRSNFGGNTSSGVGSSPGTPTRRKTSSTIEMALNSLTPVRGNKRRVVGGSGGDDNDDDNDCHSTTSTSSSFAKLINDWQELSVVPSEEEAASPSPSSSSSCPFSVARQQFEKKNPPTKRQVNTSAGPKIVSPTRQQELSPCRHTRSCPDDDDDEDTAASSTTSSSLSVPPPQPASSPTKTPSVAPVPVDSPTTVMDDFCVAHDTQKTSSFLYGKKRLLFLPSTTTTTTGTTTNTGNDINMMKTAESTATIIIKTTMKPAGISVVSLPQRI